MAPDNAPTSAREHRITRLVAVGLIALTAAACSSEAGGDASATTTSMTTQVPVPACEERATDTTAPAVDQGGAVGNDPFTARGARQVPGPDMTTTTLPATPVSMVVDIPPDPDEHVAARQVDGKVNGPVPESRGVIEASSSETSTSTSSAHDETATTTALECLPVGAP